MERERHLENKKTHGFQRNTGMIADFSKEITKSRKKVVDIPRKYLPVS